MRKFIILLFIFISCVTHPTAKNWYVSTTSSGNASGDNWENKRSWDNFDVRVISPGDTVFFDGGADSLIYSQNKYTVGANKYIIYLTNANSGTPTNKIVFTRGKDSGHNGIPILRCDAGSQRAALNTYQASYVEISYFQIEAYYGPAFYISYGFGVDLLHNTFLHPTARAITANYVRNMKIMHNTFKTTSINSILTNDAIQGVGGATGDNTNVTGNFEIAYNTFIDQHTYQGTSPDPPHVDMMQLSYFQNTGGVSKIHHNYFLQNSVVTPTYGAGILLQDVAGTWLVYDNVFNWRNSNSTILGHTETQPDPPNKPALGIYVMNNSFYLQSPVYAATRFYGLDTLFYVNNLVHKMGTNASDKILGWDDYMINNCYMFIDYNHYYLMNENTVGRNYTASTSYSKAQWLSLFGDTHSIWDAFNYSNSSSINVEDYKLPEGSPAIDAGTDLSAYFDDDFAGTKRPVGARWDVGAFEWTGTKVGTDNTPPTLLGATVINPNSIELSFSEELETTSAQTKGNYTISNGITVNSAALSSDKKKVTLNTSTNSANQNYTVTVTNVKDLSENVITSNNSAQYSFSSTTTGNLKANIKVYLQGAYSGSAMITALAENTFLPSYQPYNSAPWNYNGSEKISISNLNGVVDWVLVELRNAQNPSQIVSRKAGLLRNDGIITETDGTTGITFNNLLYGSYYIAIRHRNHLAVMSSSPIQLAPSNSYDFTKSLASAFGQNAEAEIATGLFGMFAGDGDANGNINDSDRNDIWSTQNGNMGYLNGDFNLDCGVTVKDTNNYWNANQGKVTQVP